MSIDYRDIAQQRLKKADELLATKDDDNLIYACLELRKCVESLAYELLAGYLHEVPLKAIQTWQPDKVIRELLRIDPRADKGRYISMQKAATDTEPEGPWISLGEERRLSADRTAKMFHQLGGFIHVPTIKQLENSETADFAQIRRVAEKIKAELEHVLSATIWTRGHVAPSFTFNCTECGTPIRRTIEVLKKGDEVECGNCGNLFDAVHDEADDGWSIHLKAFTWTCSACDTPRQIPQKEAKGGLDVSCPKCKNRAWLKSILSWQVGQADPKPQQPAA